MRQYRLVINIGDLLRADPEARWASWQRARQAGVLSPNDVRREIKARFAHAYLEHKADLGVP